MGENLFSYLERLEAMAFFSGYCLVYALIRYLLATKKGMFSVLPGLLLNSYALVATLFLGYVSRKLFLQYSQGVDLELYHPLLYLIGVLAVLFWIPVFRTTPLLSFIHSLVFFFFVVWDVTRFILGRIERSELRNVMNILTVSFLFNVAALILFFIRSWLVLRLRGSRGKL
jgi:hypothetical protein